MDADSTDTARFDWTLGVAVACLACSWFLFDSLTTDLGAFQLDFYFYNLLTLMRSPGRIITGASGNGGALDAFVFGMVLVGVIAAACAPLVSTRRIAWLGCAAPLALMVLVGIIMYHDLSQDFIADTGVYGDTGSRFIHVANSLAGHVGNMVARRVHVGLGGYLGLAATGFLAFKGARSYRLAEADRR